MFAANSVREATLINGTVHADGEMQSLHRQASLWSGVKQEDASAIDDVNLYERLGFEAFVKLSTNFYNK